MINERYPANTIIDKNDFNKEDFQRVLNDKLKKLITEHSESDNKILKKGNLMNNLLVVIYKLELSIVET